MVVGISKTPREFIFEPFAAIQDWSSFISGGLLFLKDSWKLYAFLHVIAALVSNSPVKVFPPVVTLVPGLVSP